ncbi:MAG: amino acid adenylation domain-containing protein, partial [Ktedonobacteraceae bacterium]
LNANPLFQVMFALQNAPYSALEFSGVQVKPFDMEYSTSRFDLMLNIYDRAEGLSGGLEYDRDLFRPETTARLLGHYQHLLQQLVAHPEQPVSSYCLLTTDEYHQLVVWNATAVRWPYPPHTSVQELIARQAARTPDALALVFQEQQLTYGELLARAQRLAQLLGEQGVGPETRVALALQRSPLLVIALLAVLYAGGAYIPLDPDYPAARLAFLLQDAQPRLLLSQSALVELLPASEIPVLLLDALPKPGEQTPLAPAALAPVCRGEQLAYVIYTSGSTGQPKGAMLPQQGLLNRLLWMQQTYPLSASDRVLQKTPMSFDVSVWEFFWPLLTGACLVLARPGGQRESGYLRHLLREQAITTLHFVPSLLSVFLQEQPLPHDLALRQVFSSGEALSLEVQTRFFQQSRAALFNLYGPTEASIDVSFWTCRPVPGSQRVPIGQPIANTQLYVLDAHGQPQPLGVAGDLFIGGISLARGYLGRPDLTAERFRPDPFSRQPGARLYWTGDRACWRLDERGQGVLEYLGRGDQQIKLRGFRIELGEIESALRAHPAVREAVVVLREDTPEQKLLVAYVVSEPGQQPDHKLLRDYLRTVLPEYMLPSATMLLTHLPLSPNGKLDRRALPAPGGIRADPETYVSPRSPLEKTLAHIWAEILRRDRVSIHDTFFDAGGDSILALLMIARARQAGLRFTPRQLFRYQTIAELATVVENIHARASEEEQVHGPMPLSPIQRWFFELNLTNVHHYNQAMLLELLPEMQPVLLKQALQHLWRHHATLRLRFMPTAEGWRQWYAEGDESIVWQELDLTQGAHTSRDALARIRAEAVERAHMGLNLQHGPVGTALFLTSGPQEPAQLLLIFHHLVIDAISWHVLLEDLQTAYTQLSQGRSVDLPPVTSSIRAWVECLQAYARTEILRNEATRWLRQAEQSRRLMPVDYPGGKNIFASMNMVRVALREPETSLLLHAIPQGQHVQVHEFLLAALCQTWKTWTGSYRLLVDVEGHGREDLFEEIELQRTVGWFTTIYPQELELTPDLDTIAALNTIKEQVRAIPHRGLGYGVLRYLCEDQELRERMQNLPGAEISFNYLGQVDQVLAPFTLFQRGDGAIGPLHNPTGQRPYILDFIAQIQEGRLLITWLYSDHLHDRETIEELAGSYLRTLTLLIAGCQEPVTDHYAPSDFPLAGLTQQELDEIVIEFEGSQE